MAIVRSYTNNFEVIDRTEQLLSIPNSWDIINRLGIFGAVEGVTTNTVSFEDIIENTAVMTDQVRGQRNVYTKDAVRKLRSYPIPHYPIDGFISPEQIQGKTAYGSNDQADTVAAAVARELNRIRRAHLGLQEVARAKLLEDGTVYAPNGTVSVNYYTDFGVTRKEVDFVFGTSTTDIIGKIEEGIAYITDNRFDGTENITGFVAICSPEFFANLIKHPKVQTAYQYYSSTQEPLRMRLDGDLPKGTREFIHGGVRFVEYRGLKPDGTRYIPSGEARLLPTGLTDIFSSFAAPALKMDLVNTVGMEAYVFQYNDAKGNGISFESEANIVHVCKRPQLIIRLHSST
jgi:hypothetical protein